MISLLSRALKPAIKQPQLAYRMFSMQRRRGGQQYPNNNNNNNNTPIDIAISSQNSRDFNSKLQEILEKDASSIANISFFKLNGLINNWFKFDLRINEQLQMDMLN